VDGQRHTEKIHLELAVWMSPSLGPHAFGIGWERSDAGVTMDTGLTLDVTSSSVYESGS
jgi:hypothetical protein